jgi:16S rRNA (cytosine1402-N4)-methyltransferase
VTLQKQKGIQDMDQTPKQKKEVPYNQNTSHVPVLMKEVLECLDPKPGDRYLDLTTGFGGHAAAVITLTESPQGSVLVDRDKAAITAINDQFSEAGATIMQSDFLLASKKLLQEKRQFDVILADLGVSSLHLNEAKRGFSIRNDGPLDMRMDQQQSLQASEVVNSYSEKAIIKILRDYGEEPKAVSIARQIIAHRPIRTTSELASIVARIWPGKHKIHPATRTFQALRITVNDELSLLAQSLPLWIQLLAPGGRIAIISFHSLEDRMVKQALQELSGDNFDAELKLLTKKPITPGRDELDFNPRARSAKLRAAAKIKIKERGVANAYPGKK